jgi:hypothetical protein
MAGAGDEAGRGGVVITSSIHCVSTVTFQIWIVCLQGLLTIRIRLAQDVGREQRPPGCGQLRAVHRVSKDPYIRLFWPAQHRTAPANNENEPLVNVEVLRQVGCQTSCGRRAVEGVHIEVIGARFLHRQILEVEAILVESRQGRV